MPDNPTEKATSVDTHSGKQRRIATFACRRDVMLKGLAKKFHQCPKASTEHADKDYECEVTGCLSKATAQALAPPGYL
ncbi:hypothetical protein [Phytopseudomonas seleniipraecipitans]|uniref:Uncharacterized protein n=1 Tax=Phytopseudomonas seleniipraecipitans TaxID=640205 RepID=A0A1G7NBV2_9GAMM|nr:hypothetical protein [Pseudomonas seleniipraecipitans]SDF71523.1 hypothetical protein SAMN05216381_2227 [Pseudomonas seleniipraecipitans]